MVNTIYQKSFAALMKRPFRLWGISLLGALLCWLAGIGFAGILAVGFAIAWAIDVSLAMIFLHTYQTGEEPHTADLFQTFRKDRFLRVVGGMAWMSLWIFLWSLIPVVGIVFGVIRMYEYRFVPYILMTRDDVKPTDALRVSREQTMGYKGKMFWADVIPVLLWIAVVLVLSLLGIIPYLGVLFRVILFLQHCLRPVPEPVLRHSACGILRRASGCGQPRARRARCPAGDPRAAGPEGGSTCRGSKTGRKSE